MKYIFGFIITLTLSFCLLVSTYTTSDYVANLYVLLVSQGLLVAAMIFLNIGFKKSRSPRYKKIKIIYNEKKFLKKIILIVLVVLNVMLLVFYIKNAVYQSQHRNTLLLEYKDIPVYKDGLLSVEDVEIKKLEPEEEAKPIKKEFAVDNVGGRKITCGIDIPSGEYTISDSSQDYGTMLFSYFNEGEGIGQGQYLDMHDPFYCIDGRQVMAYNGTGSFTMHTFNRPDVRDNYETVDINKEVKLNKWTGEIEEESCFVTQSDDTEVNLACSEMEELATTEYNLLNTDITKLKSNIPIAAMQMDDQVKYFDSIECSELADHETSIQYSDSSLVCFDSNDEITDQIFGELSVNSNELNVWDSDLEDGSLNYD